MSWFPFTFLLFRSRLQFLWSGLIHSHKYIQLAAAMVSYEHEIVCAPQKLAGKALTWKIPTISHCTLCALMSHNVRKVEKPRSTIKDKKTERISRGAAQTKKNWSRDSPRSESWFCCRTPWGWIFWKLAGTGSGQTWWRITAAARSHRRNSEHAERTVCQYCNRHRGPHRGSLFSFLFAALALKCTLHLQLRLLPIYHHCAILSLIDLSCMHSLARSFALFHSFRLAQHTLFSLHFTFNRFYFPACLLSHDFYDYWEFFAFWIGVQMDAVGTYLIQLHLASLHSYDDREGEREEQRWNFAGHERVKRARICNNRDRTYRDRNKIEVNFK